MLAGTSEDRSPKHHKVTDYFTVCTLPSSAVSQQLELPAFHRRYVPTGVPSEARRPLKRQRFPERTTEPAVKRRAADYSQRTAPFIQPSLPRRYHLLRAPEFGSQKYRVARFPHCLQHMIMFLQYRLYDKKGDLSSSVGSQNLHCDTCL